MQAKMRVIRLIDHSDVIDGNVDQLFQLVNPLLIANSA
jgi:hypothetical protein